LIPLKLSSLQSASLFKLFFECRVILTKKVYFYDKVNNIAYITEPLKNKVKSYYFWELNKRSIVVRSIIKDEVTKVLFCNTKSCKEGEDNGALI
jgi:hypothetical protein